MFSVEYKDVYIAAWYMLLYILLNICHKKRSCPHSSFPFVLAYIFFCFFFCSLFIYYANIAACFFFFFFFLLFSGAWLSTRRYIGNYIASRFRVTIYVFLILHKAGTKQDNKSFARSAALQRKEPRAIPESIVFSLKGTLTYAPVRLFT